MGRVEKQQHFMLKNSVRNIMHSGGFLGFFVFFFLNEKPKSIFFPSISTSSNPEMLKFIILEVSFCSIY